MIIKNVVLALDKQDVQEHKDGDLALMAERNGELTKTRFEEYLCSIKKIVRKKEQLAVISAKLGSPHSAKLSEIPKNKPLISTDKTLFLIQEKIELESQIKKLNIKREKEWIKLNKAVTLLESPQATKNISRKLDILSIEASILRMRYFSALEWPEINRTFYGTEPDFDIKIDDYMKKIFRYHGWAFVDLRKIERF